MFTQRPCLHKVVAGDKIKSETLVGFKGQNEECLIYSSFRVYMCVNYLRYFIKSFLVARTRSRKLIIRRYSASLKSIFTALGITTAEKCFTFLLISSLSFYLVLLTRKFRVCVRNLNTLLLTISNIQISVYFAF